MSGFIKHIRFFGNGVYITFIHLITGRYPLSVFILIFISEVIPVIIYFFPSCFKLSVFIGMIIHWAISQNIYPASHKSTGRTEIIIIAIYTMLISIHVKIFKNICIIFTCISISEEIIYIINILPTRIKLTAIISMIPIVILTLKPSGLHNTVVIEEICRIINWIYAFFTHWIISYRMISFTIYRIKSEKVIISVNFFPTLCRTTAIQKIICISVNNFPSGYHIAIWIEVIHISVKINRVTYIIIPRSRSIIKSIFSIYQSPADIIWTCILVFIISYNRFTIIRKLFNCFSIFRIYFLRIINIRFLILFCYIRYLFFNILRISNIRYNFLLIICIWYCLFYVNSFGIFCIRFHFFRIIILRYILFGFIFFGFIFLRSKLLRWFFFRICRYFIN